MGTFFAVISSGLFLVSSLNVETVDVSSSFQVAQSEDTTLPGNDGFVPGPGGDGEDGGGEGSCSLDPEGCESEGAGGDGGGGLVPPPEPIPPPVEGAAK